MNHLLFFLADIDPNDILNAEQQYLNSPRLKEVLIISGTLFAAIVVAAIWAFRHVKRKKRRHRYRHHHHPHSQVEGTANEQIEKSGASQESRSSKRRRRTERPMNPTLAQTGGLPPIRDEKPHWPPSP
ncbi:MAG TPA: hypothetical protein VG754_11680 [Verrucomicrobiae bacterium]|jgi:hypothetical protein|nr:hypothetical protein [Verrucomicrobiae bacterium]